ncbi:helicase associated domain-containing protein [Streptomyces mirabilis]|uniref:helicase associated domain-containing protein n=1 Tax=Streptomyces mirabilis TaxID=68239 RepID=UPI0036CC1DE7
MNPPAPQKDQKHRSRDSDTRQGVPPHDSGISNRHHPTSATPPRPQHPPAQTPPPDTPSLTPTHRHQTGTSHAFAEGLSAAAGWAAQHGHLLPPTTATWNGYPVGVWAKNLRTAGRKLAEIEARREAGLPVGPTTGTLTEERRDALEAIDPS